MALHFTGMSPAGLRRVAERKKAGSRGFVLRMLARGIPVNIREIAKKAKVSVATVSRCLNQPEKVSEETRNKILKIMREAKYMPSPSAQSLSTGQTRMIGCMVPSLHNAFFAQLAEGCQRVLTQHGYRMLVYTTDHESDFWNHFNQRGVDGLVISGTDFTISAKPQIDKIVIPYVLIENSEEMQSIAQSPKTVYIDDAQGVQTALQYLYAEGNRVFGVVAFAHDTFVTQRRSRAVREFFATHPDCTFYEQSSDYTDLYQAQEACRAFLTKEPRPTAIFTFNDMIAAGVVRHLLESGVHIPGEMEIIGFDDIPLASFYTPSLSTVSAPNRRLGEKAAEMLLRSIEGKASVDSILFPVDLKLRESTKNSVPLENII